MIVTQHYGLDSFGGVAHKGTREDCSHPDCAWPRNGDFVTATSGDRERTGELTFEEGSEASILTTSEKSYPIDPATIRKPDWGVYCRHGLKLIEAKYAVHTCKPGPRPPCPLGEDDPFHVCEPEPCHACLPAGRKVRPWPCERPGCTEADLDREEQAMEDDYHAELNQLVWDQYYT